MRIADAWIDPQSQFQPPNLVLVTRELRYRIEDHLVGKLLDRFDVAGGKTHAVGMNFLAEFFPPQPGFEQGTTRGSIQEFPHETEYAPS